MFLARPPGPALLPYVSTLWLSRASADEGRELVLPTGNAHLVLRLDGPPLHVFATATAHSGRSLGHAILGGPRARPYFRAVGGAGLTVGAQLRPGALVAFGFEAAAVADRHAALGDLWRGAIVSDAMNRLVEMDDPRRRLDTFEAWLAARLHPTHRPRVEVLGTLPFLRIGNTRVEALAAESGWSPRRFRDLFVEAVGISPKRYSRVLRVQACIELLRGQPTRSLADVGIACGYGDQAHMNRDFAEIVGLSPQRYRRLALLHSHHVPIDAPAVADSSKTPAPQRTRIAA